MLVWTKKKKKEEEVIMTYPSIGNQCDFPAIPCRVIICADGRRTHKLVMREKRNKSRNQLKMMLVSSD